MESPHHALMDRSRYRAGPRSLATILPKASATTFRKRGFAHARILSGWREIVGNAIAAGSCPERLSFTKKEKGGATLRIRVAGGLALELQHLEPIVVERINSHFGYRAVERLSLVQGPLPTARTEHRPPPRELSAAERAELDRQLAAVADEPLRHALKALGESMAARRAA
jgi:hypothetical protein